MLTPLRSSSVFTNSTLSFMSVIGQGLVNFVAVAYLARVLGPHSYGAFSYTWAFASMFGFLSYLGLPPLLTRRLGENHRSPNKILSDGLVMTGTLSILSAIAFLVVVNIVPSLYRYHLFFDLWVLVFFQVGLDPRWVYSAIQHLWISSLLDFVAAAARLSLLVSFIRSPHDVLRAVGITMGVYLTMTVVGWAWLRRLYVIRIRSVPFKHLIGTIGQSLPMGLTAMVGILYSGMDMWILEVFKGSTEVGYYTAAYRPITFLLTLSILYFNIAFPLLSRLRMTERKAMQRLIEFSLISVLGLTLPAAVGAVIVAGPLMVAVFGEPYAASGPILAILIWSWATSLLRDVFYTTLLSEHHEKTFARYFTVSGVVNVVLMLIMVRWGAVGTAGALVATQTLLLILSAIGVSRVKAYTFNLSVFWKPVAKITFNTAVMVTVVGFIVSKVSVWAAVAIGIMTYAILTVFIKPITLKGFVGSLKGSE